MLYASENAQNSVPGRPVLLPVGQNPKGYLDVYIATVKSEKRAEFDAVSKKMVELNRRNKGDYWLAAETLFGEMNTVYFTSQRQNYADIEKAFDASMAALSNPAGTAGGQDLPGLQQHDHQLAGGGAS